ncbi:MAG: hypothetical protein V4662_13355 [Verrucomicrobiota bacterium]
MHSPRPIPRDLQSRIDLELESGERIQWMDMPIPRYFTPYSTKAFIFAIPWTAFALFWTYAAADFEMPDLRSFEDLFCLFGVPFILIGIALFCTPFWAYHRALKTVYVITDHRAIILEGGRTAKFSSYPPEALTCIILREHKDGTGDIIISGEVSVDSDGDSSIKELGFFQIPSPKETRARLDQLAGKPSQRKPLAHT